ncbi:MAG: hypothetical protein M1833_004357 [Piccolia ochrophora]|nr:MAG: hypothetical protein M1833_004357 [Piccolia ochrophora]
MSDAQRFLLTVDNDKREASEIAVGTAKREHFAGGPASTAMLVGVDSVLGIEKNDAKLLEVVQSLGEYLIDDDATVRARSVAYLAAVLASLDPKFLSKQQLSVTVQFFCDRIQDATGLKEAAEGLAAVQKSFRFSSEHAIQIATCLFTGAQDLQQHPQSSRFVVLKLMDALLADQRKAMKSMKDDFIVGITDLVSGEKDPRNLMIIFSMLRVVMVEWVIVDHVETLFDSVFCYFPITFRPPPDDPYGITAQDLKNRLRDCISASPYFAGHAFPALLDKLDSTSPNVKKDVLQTIAACASSYSPPTMSNNCTQLWDSMKYEVFNAQEEDLADEALQAIQAIAKCLSADATSATVQSSLSRFLRPITTECNEQLREPQQKQAKPAGQMLGVVARASPISFSLVLRTALPPLFPLYQDAGSIGKRRALLEVVNQLLESANAIFEVWSSSKPPVDIENPLDPFRDRLFEIYSQALMGAAKGEVSYRVTSLRGLLLMANLQGFLAEDEIGMIVQYLNDILLLEEVQGRGELRHEAIGALTSISKFRPNLVTDITFPAFMARLPDFETNGEQAYVAILEGLAKISVENSVFELLVRRLLNKFDMVLQGYSSPAYPHAILSTVLYVLEQRELDDAAKVQLYFQRLVIGLSHTVTTSLTQSANSTLLSNDALLDVIGRLGNVIVRRLDDGRQHEVANNMYNLFTPDFKPVLSIEQVSKEYSRTMIVSTYLLAGIRPNILISDDINSHLQTLVSRAMHETDPSTRLAYLRQVALIANKWLNQDHTPLLEHVIQRLLGVLNDNTNDNEPPSPRDTATNALRVLFYLTKGLLLRLSPLINPLLDSLLTLLAHPSQGAAAARGFALLLAPDPLLSKANHSIIRLLHRQRLFHYCVPKVAELFRSTTNQAVRPNYLVALSGILRYVPSDIIMSQLDTLTPLLLQSIDLPDAPVRAATIETLTMTIKDSPKALETHIPSLTARILSACSAPDAANPLRVRLAALQCLQLFPAAFRHELLLPYRAQVARKLMASLDDPKRDVRKEAVDCRAVWLRMDEPED